MTSNMTVEQETFVNNIYNALLRFAPYYEIECYSPIIAQAILESGWNRSKLSSKYHNYFGLKCGSNWKGKSVNLTTKEEYTTGTLTTIKDNFRVYDSLEEGVRGYLIFINTKRYSNLKHVTDPVIYLQNIKADGYATSSKYVENLLNVIDKYDLNRYNNNNTNVEKDYQTIAKEVILGYWGTGEERKRRLTEIGYDYKKVQGIVNKMLLK